MERLKSFNTSHGNILNNEETEMEYKLELELELTNNQDRLELALDQDC